MNVTEFFQSNNRDRKIQSLIVGPLAGCGKTQFLRNTPRSAHVACWCQNRPQDAQKGRPARPQRAKWRIVLLPYGEPLSDARTPLADFFRILLDRLVVREQVDGCGVDLPRLSQGTWLGRSRAIAAVLPSLQDLWKISSVLDPETLIGECA